VLNLKNIFFWFMMPCSLIIMYRNSLEARRRLVICWQQHRATKNTTKEIYCHHHDNQIRLLDKSINFILWKMPKLGLGRRVVEVLDHTKLYTRNTHTHSQNQKHPSILLCTSDQLVAEGATCTTNKRNEHPCCQRDSNPRSQQSGG